MTVLESGNERLASALGELAADASQLFEDLLAGGAELPFEVDSTERGPLPMYHYEPRTEDFVRGHVAELRRLDPFVEVRSRLGEEGAIGFLVSLFEGLTEFTVDEDRLARLVRELGADAEHDTMVLPSRVIVPMVGLRAEVDQIELGEVRIVRSDLVDDAPEEAVDAAGATHGDWGPGFLALVPCAAGPQAAAAVVSDDLRRMLTALRLFKQGSVGIHTHAWARRAADWASFPTGGARPRSGGYLLSAAEASELAGFGRRIADRPRRRPALAWAIARFELGSERPTLIEALSDYLLALRALLEGGGPARADLAARVAAISAEPDERERIAEAVKRAVAVERKLMAGARFPASEDSPLRAVGEVEELLRAMLRDMATGELGLDLRETADEILVADGMRAAEPAPPSTGESAEWRIPDPEAIEHIELELGGADQPTETVDASEQDTRIIACGVELAGEMARRPQTDPGSDDWFAQEEATDELEWPAFASPRRRREQTQRPTRTPTGSEEGETRADRVRYLFPVPDETDWSVGELDYDRDSARVK